jgi:2,3-bisphosphoglycerate-dependent phosphoglycerate mutase
MQLYFVRHGQSENNLLWDRTGADKGRSDDPALTEIGRRQAALVAQFLSRPKTVDGGLMDLHNVYGFGITHVYASLMIRAIETGSAIAKALGLPLVALEALHEAGGIYFKDEETGEYIQRPGKNRVYFQTQFPDCVLPDCVTEEGWWNRPYETPEQCLPRARRALDELWVRHGQSEERVVVVTHGAFYNYMLTVILNLPESSSNQYWFVMNNCAITRIDFIGERVIVPYTNRVDFLPKELIT